MKDGGETMDTADSTATSAALLEADLIPDGRLADASGDDLEHDAVAAVLADLVSKVQTPANIALFGPWGSGKSSLYGMIAARLEMRADSGVKMIRYDAWKFGGHSLQRNFLSHVAEELELKDRHISRIHGATETSRLRLGRFLRRNWGSLVVALLLAFGLAAGWAFLSAWAATEWGVGTSANDAKFEAELVRSLPSAAVVFGAVIAGLLLSNQSLASAVEKRTYSPMQDADQFFAAFERLMKTVTRWRLTKPRTKRLVVFVDELDRCHPSDVAKTLTDLLTFLDHHQCVFLVAADREVLEEALEKAPQAKPVRENEPYYSTSGAFLDKVFQHQLSLPPTRPEALTAYAMTLASTRRQGIWAELRSERTTYEDVVYSLVPAHIRSPRRVKVLLNNYATSARVMAARGLDWKARAVPVAVLTVLQTEFPSVVRDLLVQPRLLEALTGALDDAMSTELAAVVAGYRRTDEDDDVTTEESSAAPLLTDRSEVDNEAAEHAARRRLNEQFVAYLGKIHAADIPLPTADLVYLQRAGHAEGLENAELSRILDVAADTAPDTLVTDFEDASTGDRKAAVRFLTTQLGSNFGPSRANLVESACRLAEQLDVEAARDTARFAAGALLNEARNGRWRSDATPGVLRLALLDDHIADPMAPLAGTGELERMGANGSLGVLLPLMPHLADRAALLFSYFGNEYRERPALMHDALSTLPCEMATALWNAEKDAIVAEFEAPIAPIRSAATTRTVKSATASAAARATVDTAAPAEHVQRYGDLLKALIGREGGLIPTVLREVILISLRTDVDSDLYAEVVADLDRLITGFGDDTASQNHVVLHAIAREASAPGVERWTQFLVTDSPTTPDRSTVGATSKVVVTELCQESLLVDRSVLLNLYGDLSGWLDADRAEHDAQIIYSGLTRNPPAGMAENAALRDGLRRALSVLETVDGTVEYASTYITASLVEVIAAGQASATAIGRFIEEIQSLAPHDAAQLDDKIAAMETYPTIFLARLRIAARKRAARKTLRALELNRVLVAATPDPGLLAEWVGATPTLVDFNSLLRTVTMPKQVVAAYAEQRNISDRSKVWIALEKKGYPIAHLEAAGTKSVNATVVKHMESRIVGVRIEDQSNATRRLITANLAEESSARVAAHEMAMSLLQADVAGAGPNAAKIVLRAGGAAPRRKPELRAAFDNYTTKFPKQRIPNGDLQRLNDLGLFTKRKKSPLAKVLPWFD